MYASSYSTCNCKVPNANLGLVLAPAISLQLLTTAALSDWASNHRWTAARFSVKPMRPPLVFESRLMVGSMVWSHETAENEWLDWRCTEKLLDSNTNCKICKMLFQNVGKFYRSQILGGKNCSFTIMYSLWPCTMWAKDAFKRFVLTRMCFIQGGHF